MILAVDDLEIDLVRSGIWRDDRLHALGPRALDLLVYLIEHRDRVVSQEELRREVWDSHAVGDSAVSETLRQARDALGLRPDGSDFIESSYAHGYRFVSESVRKMWIVSRDPNRVPTFDSSSTKQARQPFDFVHAAFDAALAGHATSMLFCGEGATDLRERSFAEARERAVTALRVDCVRAGDCLKRIADGLGIDAPPGSADDLCLDDVARLAASLRRVSAESGAMLWFEDFEQAGPWTFELWEQLGASPVATRVLLLGCYDEARAHDARSDARLGGLVRATNARVIRLP